MGFRYRGKRREAIVQGIWKVLDNVLSLSVGWIASHHFLGLLLVRVLLVFFVLRLGGIGRKEEGNKYKGKEKTTTSWLVIVKKRKQVTNKTAAVTSSA